MKKQNLISLFLCISVLLTYLAIPVSAISPDMTEVVATDPQLPSVQTAPSTELTSSVSHLPFGQASIQQGCRTLDGKMPLAGSERRLPSAQGVFAYEATSGTVIYSYNPDV